MEKSTKKKEYVVYQITYNGELKYIGITYNFTRRKYQHIYYIGKHTSAIPEGTDLTLINFQVVMSGLTESKALKEENKLIKRFNLIKMGWNSQESGHITRNKTRYWRDYNADRKEKVKEYQHNWYLKHKKID